jgi:hypothetical protein
MKLLCELEQSREKRAQQERIVMRVKLIKDERIMKGLQRKRTHSEIRSAPHIRSIPLFYVLHVKHTLERATTMRPSRSRMSARSVVRASTAMISEATVMSKPASREAGVRRGSPLGDVT